MVRFQFFLSQSWRYAKLARGTVDEIGMWPDIALQSILGMALTRGMLAYSSGTEFGRPYIHLGPVALMASLDEQADIFKLFGNRVAQKTMQLFNK